MKIERYLKIELPKGQSCFLWGARKTGKSTYLKDRFPDSKYINLLQADVYQRYFRNPERLREELIAQPDNTGAIIIDEVQKVPLLLDEVHYLIEEFKNISFILCGSSVRKLKSNGANLLGGRAWRYLFQPLCYPELKELNFSRIFKNGLIPSHYLAETNIEKHLASYLYDYILPEIEFEAKLRKREAFAKFLDVAGTSNGEMVQYNNIARDSGINAKTVRAYYEILQDMYLGYFVYPYKSKTRTQVITETSKFYFFDTGLANYLRRYQCKDLLGVEAGKSFEHYVFLELMAYKNLCEKREQIFYWRTKEGYEVDFIIQDQAFEVKLSDSINSTHLKGLTKFSEHNDLKLGVICLEPKKRIISLKNNMQVTIWPVQEFLEMLWGHQVWC